MKKTYFIIGDIHGEADMMEEMLTKLGRRNSATCLYGRLD